MSLDIQVERAYLQDAPDVGDEVASPALAQVVFFHVTATGGSAMVRRFFRRGDADCSVGLTAADIVAAARGLGGNSICRNDDCDRDGRVTLADVDCTARCLFDECAVPPHAPRVTSVLPDSAPAIVPFATVRVNGTNFGAADRLKRVTIGGAEAGVAEVLPETLIVVVPDIPPGPADVVVSDGQLSGFPSAATITAAVPIGDRDTFDGTLALLDAAIAEFSALDLEAGYGSNASVVRDALDAFREDVERQRVALAADPTVTADVRQRLDATFEASGMPELLRNVIAQLNGAATGAVGSGASDATTVQLLAPVVGQATRVLGTVATSVGATLTLPEMVAIGTGLVITAGVVVVALDSEALTPVVVKMSFADTGTNRREFPTAGGTAIVTGVHLDAFTTGLNVVTAAGEWRQSGESCGEGCLAFPLPNAEGFCGGVIFTLTRGPLRSNSFVARIQPELLDLSTAFARPGDYFTMDVRGTVGCDAQAQFAGFRRGVARAREIASDAVGAQVPEGLPPGRYAVRAVVESVVTQEERSLELLRVVTDVTVQCEPAQLVAPPGSPNRGLCVASPAGASPGGGSDVQFPDGTVFEWQSSNLQVARFASASQSGELVDVDAVGPGRTTMTAEAFVTNEDGSQRQFLARSANGFVIEVRDDAPPTVTLAPRGPLVVEPGTSGEVRVEANDNTVITRLRVAAMGDAAVLPEAEYQCFQLEKRCAHTFTVNFRDPGVAQAPVTIVGEAFDGAGLKGTSDPLTYTVARADGRIAGVVRNQADNTSINAAAVELFDAAGTFLARTTTSADGTFAFENLVPGPVRVRASKSGFRAAEQTVRVQAGQTTEVTLPLVRLTETATLRGSVEDPIARVFSTGDRYIAGATVTVIDATQAIAGSDVTDVNGVYEISGLPLGNAIIRADKAGFATASVRRNPGSGITSLVDFDLYPVNDACGTNRATFEFVSGHLGIGGSGVNFGEADFTSALNQVLIRPDAAQVCLSGNPAVPTIDWHRERIHTCCGPFGSSVYDIFMEEVVGSTTTQLWRVSVMRRMPENEILPPVIYGDHPVGTNIFGAAPDLRSDGTLYRLIVQSSSWDVVFRVKP